MATSWVHRLDLCGESNSESSEFETGHASSILNFLIKGSGSLDEVKAQPEVLDRLTPLYLILVFLLLLLPGISLIAAALLSFFAFSISLDLLGMFILCLFDLTLRYQRRQVHFTIYITNN